MRKYSVLFFIRQSVQGLFMNAVSSVSSIVVLMSCLILMGCFGLLLSNINLNLEQIDSFNRIVFFIDEEASKSPEEIENIKSQIESFPNTESIRFISASEALAKVREQFGDEYSELFDEVAAWGNTIHDSIEIEYKNIDAVGTLVYQLKSVKGLFKLKNKTETAEFIKSLKNIVMGVMVWFLIILFVIAIFIILNTIKSSVDSRKSEIKIMRYIGATKLFILFPFLLEGVFIGLFSALVAYLIQGYIYNSAIGGILRMDSAITVVSYGEVRGIVFIAFIGVGILCGLIGSAISSRRYLKV
ncbi:cell division protein FtsX [Clostridia bacterium]|nr:cell division protein FtsX [Clostridia bacterium]GHV15010.1 cell division protein FtsX [Clostridia bacterium]